MRTCALIVMLGLVLQVGPTGASTQALQTSPTARSVPDSGPVLPYLQIHFELRKQLDSASGYRKLEDIDRIRLFQAQDRLFGLLGPLRNFEDLDRAGRAQLADIQAALLPLLALVEEHQILCRRGHSLGSRIIETRCATRASLARLERQTQWETDEIRGIGR